MAFPRGQGATEYLVILSVVLVVALVVLSLIGGFFPQAGGLSNTQSRSYWLSAQPFGIGDAAQTGQSNISLVVQNNLAQELVLSSVNLSFRGGASFINNSQTIFTAGQKRVMVIGGSPSMPTCTGRTGQAYLYMVRFVYDDDPLIGKVQASETPLAVICQ